MSAHSRPDVGFAASASVSGGKLMVEYALANRSDRTIYVFDRTARFESGTVKVEPDRMFVLLGTGEVRVLHAFIGLPELHDIKRRPPILASPVAPRTEHRRKVSLDLPLLENQQFYAANPAADPPASVARVRIQVGWVDKRPGMSVTSLDLGGKEEVELAGGWSDPTQWISEAAVELSGVSVRRHTEPFERNPSLD
jgi:hypothetical protein